MTISKENHEVDSNRSPHYRFLVPGLFLALLGIGNVVVGLSKVGQYQQVEANISADQVAVTAAANSTLSRIQVLDDKSTRIYERQKKAMIRGDMYQLVIFGGKMFIVLSLPFLLLSSLLYFSVSTSQGGRIKNQ